MDKPFVGLVPFAEADHAYFFGRKSERRVLVDNLLASRLTLLYGESGTGKSSLLNAGVAYELRAEPEFTVVVFRSWREDPLAALAEAIQKATGNVVPLPANTPLTEIIKSCSPDNRTLLIILDQFEEYFHYSTDGKFDVELARILNRRDLPANFLISVREDWLAALDRFKGQIPGLFDNYLRMQHLSKAGAVEAIEEPLKRFNEQKNGDRVSWDENLTQRVIDSILSSQTTVEPGLHADDHVQAPYLQMVMSALWQRELELGSHQLRVSTLEDDLKGARQIYESHLSNTLSKELSAQERAAAIKMFGKLVTPSGRKQNMTVRELCVGTELAGTLVSATVIKLRDAKVLTQTAAPRGARHDEYGYEFAHDVLAEAALKYVSKEAVDAERRKAEEAEHRANRLRILIAALAIALVAAVGAGLFAWKQTKQARIERQHALDQQKSALGAKAQAELNARLALDQELVQSANAASLRYDFALAVLLASYAMRDARAFSTSIWVADADAALRSALTAVDSTSLSGFDAVASDIAWAPDGTRLAVVVGKTIQIWNIRTGERVFKDKDDGNVVAWSPDGKWLAVGGFGVTLRDGNTGKKLGRAPDARGPIAWHPTLPRLATTSSDDEVRIWQVPDLKKIDSWDAAEKTIDGISWSPDATRIATSSEDHMLKVWDVSRKRSSLNVKAYEPPELLKDEDSSDTSNPLVSWSPEGKRLLTTDYMHPLEVRDAQTGKVLHSVPGPLISMSVGTWSHNGKWLAVDSLTGQSLRVLDGVTARPYIEVPSPETLYVIRWDEKDGWIATPSVGKKVVLFHTDALAAQSPEELLALARAKVKRDLTPAECKEYLHMDSCPARP